MRDLVRKKQAPRGAICPQPIPDSGLWKLDVDDNIWQDIGLEDASSEHEPPPWLKDEQTRLGIRHMLDYDRAVEEEKRVLRERIGLQELAHEEWDVIQIAKDDASTSVFFLTWLMLTQISGEVDMIYQLEHRARELCRLCYYWSSSTRNIPAGNNNWGPSVLQIKQAGEYELAAHVTSQDAALDIEDAVSDVESCSSDGDLVEQVEAVAFHNEYLNDDPVFDSEYLHDLEPVELSRKRRRTDDCYTT